MKETILAIGGVAAGTSALSRAKRDNPDCEAILLERGPYISYASCGTVYYLAGLLDDPHRLVAMSPDQFWEKRGIAVHTGHAVRAIHPAKREVVGIELKSGREFGMRYSKLIIATGSETREPPIPGISCDGVYSLKTLDDAIAIRAYLDTNKPRHAVVVGAGYIGLELVESLRTRGIAVTLVDAATAPLGGGLAPELTARLREELERHQVACRFETAVEAILGKEHVEGVVMAGKKVAADMVLIAVGVQPNVTLAKGAGVALGETGAIAVNEFQETNIPGIYAAGDCCQVNHIVTGRPVFIPQGTSANKQGRIAGANAAGGREKFPGTAATQVLKVFDLYLARTGLTRTPAEQAGFRSQEITITKESKPGYMPGAAPITVSLVGDVSFGRILGAQLAGDESVGKRVDSYAVALHNKMTAADFANLDLAYTPAVAPVWDPILVAANVLAKRLKKMK